MQKMSSPQKTIGISCCAFCMAMVYGANVGKPIHVQKPNPKQVQKAKPMQAQKPKPIVKTVSFADVKSGRTKIVGRLGIPIGDVAVISGKWSVDRPRGKDSTGVGFVVDTVNGKKLSADIVFRDPHIYKYTFAKGVHEKDGLNQSLLVFEAIRFEGLPDAVFIRHGVRLRQAARPPGYYSTLVIVRVEKE